MAVPPVPTHDSAPSLDDEGVLEFCKRGFLLLPSAVDRDTCELTAAWLEEQGGRTLIPFPSMVLVGIGLAACLVLGLFFFAQGDQPSLRLDVAQISLLTRRGAGDAMDTGFA